MGLRPGVGRTIPMRMPWCGLSGCGDLREVVFGVALSSRTCSFGPTVPRHRDAAIPSDGEVVRVQ